MPAGGSRPCGSLDDYQKASCSSRPPVPRVQRAEEVNRTIGRQARPKRSGHARDEHQSGAGGLQVRSAGASLLGAVGWVACLALQASTRSRVRGTVVGESFPLICVHRSMTGLILAALLHAAPQPSGLPVVVLAQRRESHDAGIQRPTPKKKPKKKDEGTRGEED